MDRCLHRQVGKVSSSLRQVRALAIGHDTALELLFICPILGTGLYQVEVTTQFTGSAYLVEKPRTFRFEPELTVV